jgi:hypothetical protein
VEQVGNVQPTLSGGNHTSDLSQVWTQFAIHGARARHLVL